MKRIFKSLLIFLSYFVYDLFFKAILYSLNIDFYSLSIKNKLILSIIFYIIYILTLIFIYRKELREEIKDFKTYYKNYLSKNIIIYLIGILLMGITNIILSRITNQSLAGNESQIRNLIDKYPIYMIFSSVLFAPIIEEFIFRKTIKNIVINKYLFIIISGFIFGIAHITNISDTTELLFSISYIIMGIDFAYIYYKTNNIFTTLTFHMCHNLILIIYQLFL